MTVSLKRDLFRIRSVLRQATGALTRADQTAAARALDRVERRLRLEIKRADAWRRVYAEMKGGNMA
jgi:hypothetical protein